MAYLKRKEELPSRTKYYFDQFVNGANKQNLHPNDWDRFYKFIRAAHAGNTNLLQGELISLLMDNGFQEDDAEYLSSIYEHGRKLYKAKLPYGSPHKHDEKHRRQKKVNKNQW